MIPFSDFVRKLLRKMIGIDDITVKRLRKMGAIVGEDVELYNFQCNRKDATCLEIGNHVTLTGVHVLTHDASLKRFVGKECNKIGRVVIGNNVFIGINTIILPNVTIGNNVVVGAGSVIAKNIPENSVVVGNPARIICSLDDYIEKHKDRIKENPDLVYIGFARDKMDQAQLREFNEKIKNKIVYFMDE